MRAWFRDCQFDSYEEAYKTLGCSKRSFFRWKANGLPDGLCGELIHQKMCSIVDERWGRK